LRWTLFPKHWNPARKKAQGERFLRMAGLPDIDAADTLWRDPTAPAYKRCLAAKALGLLGKHDQNWHEADDSPVARAGHRAT